MFLFAGASVSSPGEVLGATVFKAALCSANLRTSASTSARVRTVIRTATKVSVAASVSGRNWRTTCAGKTVSGRTWYRISAVNGRSVRSLYGVMYLYAATSLFKAVAPPVTRYSACSATLRTGPSKYATIRTVIKTDTKVLVATRVAGTAWSRTCAGKAVAGSAWYRISMLNGKSVKSVYGVSYLYAAAGLFKSAVATPTPAPSPTPSPAPTPTPPPTPPPASAGIAVPSSIDATGTTNVSAALQAFINSVPDGSTIVFKAGGVYRVDPGLRFDGRSNLVFEGNGATIKRIGWATTPRAVLFFDGGDHITVRDLTLLGDNPDAGTANAYHSGGQEYYHNIQLYGVSNVEIANVTMSGAWGDCLYINTGGTDHVWSDTVWFHDSTCKLNGRMGVVVNGGRNVTVERVHFAQIAMSVLDIEPDYSYEGATNVKFIDNTVGIFGLAVQWDTLFVAACGLDGTLVDGITISGNTVAGNPHGYLGKSYGLNTRIDTARRSNIVFTNNTATVPSVGPVLRFAHIDGLTVTGNVQSLTSGVLASITDSTGVTYR